jgi:hypothetical protein
MMEDRMSDTKTTSNLNTQMANAIAAVATAQDYLDRMRKATAQARREEAIAVNRVNDAQRNFDALVAEVKKSAPIETHWQEGA